MRHRWFIVLGAVWLGAIGTGLGLLANYAAEPGQVGEVPQTWPSDPGLQLADATHTLVLAVHPRCPCTAASINELERALGNVEQLPRVYALIFEPIPGEAGDDQEAFARTRITKRLIQLPGVELVADPGSAIAAGFGALTSGHTLVYDESGQLVYSGGLTPTRAHEGPNTGSATLVSLFNGGDAIAQIAPVFGCPLCSADEPNQMATCFTDGDTP